MKNRRMLLLLVLLLAAALVVVLLVSRGGSERIGRDRALEIALRDAGLSRSDVRDVDVDYERERGGAYYEVSFEQRYIEYEYVIDAQSGEILHRDVDDG